MADKRLKTITPNTRFFGRVTSTLKNVLLPTRIGINSFLVTIKRNAYKKSFFVLERAKETTDDSKQVACEQALKKAYNEYLEAIDKYIMDSIYKKAASSSITRVERKALSDYYKVTTYKDERADEYKHRKQIFLLELDYNLLKEKQKNITSKFEKIYAEKQTKLYRGLLKTYSVKLTDGTDLTKNNLNPVYIALFNTLDSYVKNIYPLELKHSKSNKYKTLINNYETYKLYMGKLDERDNLEKKMLLLTMSRTLFTHSLPLGIVEKTYEKLLSDTRVLLLRTINTKKETKAFNMLKLIIEEYNNKILSTKIYWPDKKAKKQNEEFWKSYKAARTEDARNILLLVNEIKLLKKDYMNDIKNSKLIKYYLRKLKSMGVVVISGYSLKYVNTTFKRAIEDEPVQ